MSGRAMRGAAVCAMVSAAAAGCPRRTPAGPVAGAAAPPVIVGYDCPRWAPPMAPRPVKVGDRRRVLADRRATEAEELIAEVTGDDPPDDAARAREPARLIDAFYDLEESLRLDPYGAHATFVLAYGYRVIGRPRCAENLMARLGELAGHPRFASTVAALASGRHHAAWAAVLATAGESGSTRGDGCVIARDGDDPPIDPQHPEGAPEIGCVRPLPQLPP